MVEPLPILDYDPYAYEIHEDPYPVYRRLRDEDPVHRNERLGFWALSRYQDVMDAFRDAARFSSRHGVSLDPDAFHDRAHTNMSFLAMDPPRQTRMRALVSRGFTPRRVQSMEPRIREITREHIEAFAGAGRCDFVADFAGKLPMDVISELIGVPREDRGEVRTWADRVVHREEGVTGVPPAAAESAMKLVRYLQAMIADRRARPGDDLTSSLLEAELDGERLSELDIIGFLFLMAIAGNETTTKLLANAMYWLWRHPGERDRLRADPGMVPFWVEETLRFDNSTQALARLVTEDVELHGRTLRAGDKAVLLVGSANRDERIFPDPDRYDLLRDTSQSLSFGRGNHFCLGASLARLEGRVALEEIHARIPDYEVDSSGIERVHSVNVRGFAALPIEFPEASAG